MKINHIHTWSSSWPSAQLWLNASDWTSLSSSTCISQASLQNSSPPPMPTCLVHNENPQHSFRWHNSLKYAIYWNDLLAKLFSTLIQLEVLMFIYLFLYLFRKSLSAAHLSKWLVRCNEDTHKWGKESIYIYAKKVNRKKNDAVKCAYWQQVSPPLTIIMPKLLMGIGWWYFARFHLLNSWLSFLAQLSYI